MLVARAAVLMPLNVLVLSTFSRMKENITAFVPFTFDETFIRINEAIHGGRPLWEILQPILGHPLVTDIIDRIYYLWFPVFLLTLYWQVFTPARPLLRRQFMLAFVASWVFIGTLGAIALSSAGPAFLDNLGIAHPSSQSLMDYLNSVVAQGYPLESLVVQDMLWQAYSTGLDFPYEGISAMPSMHVAIAVLLALTGWHINRVVGIAYTLFAVVIFIGSFHLAFHYAIDGYLSAIMIAVIWWISGVIVRRDAPAAGA